MRASPLSLSTPPSPPLLLHHSLAPSPLLLYPSMSPSPSNYYHSIVWGEEHALRSYIIPSISLSYSRSLDSQLLRAMTDTDSRLSGGLIGDCGRRTWPHPIS